MTEIRAETAKTHAHEALSLAGNDEKRAEMTEIRAETVETHAQDVKAKLAQALRKKLNTFVRKEISKLVNHRR